MPASSNPEKSDRLSPVSSSRADSSDNRTERGSATSERVRGLASLMESLFSGNRTAVRSVGGNGSEPKDTNDLSELRRVLLDGPDAVFVVHNGQGTLVEVSSRAVEWTGLSREQLLRKTFPELFDDAERKTARRLCETAGSGGVQVIELPSAIPEARSRLLEFRATRTGPDGSHTVLVGRDIGERAATERYLRAERDRLNLFIRAMRDALILLSPTGDVLYVNPAAEQMFEPFELTVICHRWMAEFSKRFDEEMQGYASAYEGQTLELEDNSGHCFLVTRSFLFDSGRRASTMLVAKDITEQKKIEKQNLQLEIGLLRESKLAEFGMLSAGIAHNLNGPLQVILGYCELLDLRKQAPEEVDQIRQQALAMREIVANLMHKSRSERETVPQTVYLEDVVRTELNFLQANLFFKHHVKQVVDLEPQPPPLYGVYIDFSQVVGNLLRNAIDAMRNSPARLLTVRTHTENRHHVLVVSDTGHGISDDVKRNLFTPFFTTKPKAGDASAGEPVGTGLGLSTTRNILARYGASIAVDSLPGQGATFTVSFPIDRQPQSPSD